jgi:mannose-6-phosphate isomerase-like protein (cupin superfamily)
MTTPKISFLFVCIYLGSCQQKSDEKVNETGFSLTQIPDTSYTNKPVASFDSSDYVIKLKHMKQFYDVPGEFGYIAEGKNYGFNSLSFVLTSTQPNGGPPLHVHETEEAHIIYDGSIQYTMGGKILTAEGPYVIRIPAGTPHTFMNTGDKPINVTAVFPANTTTYKELGRNPLIKDTSVYHKHKH